MKAYELTYLTTSSLSLKEAEEYHKKIREIIEKEGGALGKEQSPGKKALAYPIKKEEEGYFACIDFEIEKKNAVTLSEKLSKEANLLRHLLIEKETVQGTEERKPSTKKKSLKPEKTKLKEIDQKIDEIL